MKIQKIIFESYKWLPFFLMVNWFIEVYRNISCSKLVLINFCFFFVLIIPFVFLHTMICRHIYTKCHNKEGDYYEL